MSNKRRKQLATVFRLLAVIAVATQLILYRAFLFGGFLLVFLLSLLLGLWLNYRLQRKTPLVDSLLTFGALFLVPPGLIGLLAKPVWILFTLLLGGVGAWLGKTLYRSRTLTILAGLWLGCLATSLATFDALSIRVESGADTWRGEPITMIDADWDATRYARVLTTFPPYYKMLDFPEPPEHGDPLTATVFGALTRGDNSFAVRPFHNHGSVELNTEKFFIKKCLPLMDMAYYRKRRQWLLLCGGSNKLVFYRSIPAGELDNISNLGLWPSKLAIHQELERVFILDPSYGRLYSYDLEAGEMLRSRLVGFGASDVIVAPGGKYVLVALPYFAKVLVLHPGNLETIASLRVPLGTAYLAADPHKKLVYGATLPTGKLSVIDAESQTAVVTGTFRSPVLELAYDPAHRWFYWLTPADIRWAPLAEILND